MQCRAQIMHCPRSSMGSIRWPLYCALYVALGAFSIRLHSALGIIAPYCILSTFQIYAQVAILLWLSPFSTLRSVFQATKPGQSLHMLTFDLSSFPICNIKFSRLYLKSCNLHCRVWGRPLSKCLRSHLRRLWNWQTMRIAKVKMASLLMSPTKPQRRLKLFWPMHQQSLLWQSGGSHHR